MSQAAPLNQAALLVSSFGGLFDAYVRANHTSKEKPVTEVTDFSVNLVLNQFPSLQQQYARSKDQDAAEDRVNQSVGVTSAMLHLSFSSSSPIPRLQIQ